MWGGERETMKEAICPPCKRRVPLTPDLDGYNRPTNVLRFMMHAGRRWGRLCKQGGELAEGAHA